MRLFIDISAIGTHSMTQLSPATDLLLAIARRFAGTESPEGLRFHAGRISDWSAAMDLGPCPRDGAARRVVPQH